MDSGVERIVLQFGSTERLNVPERLREVADTVQLSTDDIDTMTYSIGRETIPPDGDIEGMAVWREAVFAAMQRNAERSASSFCSPARQEGEAGLKIAFSSTL